MKILVIDGMGGGLGKAVVEAVKQKMPKVHITAVGTNSLATAAMLKAGADVGASGENAVIYNCKQVDVIIGAVGVLVANAMHGEISPTMAFAVGESSAHKLLIPIGKCSVSVCGVTQKPLGAHVEEVIEKLSLTKEEKSV